MADTVFVKPTSPEFLVRDPITMAHLAADGEEKPLDQHWQRRINDGDVVVCKPPKAAKAKE
ncbi:MAG: DUF2635 domain-containing protein [Nitrospirota bacterium]|nr:DUF2635 domain-containing protein [Nitrospirota bacterium]